MSRSLWYLYLQFLNGDHAGEQYIRSGISAEAEQPFAVDGWTTTEGVSMKQVARTQLGRRTW